jgi:energy-coupling factor transporter ATP-binding protein EcfA2
MQALNRPVSWWGWHGWDHPEPLSIVQILERGTMPAELAATLWLALERGASIVLASDPPGSGKTTILTALLAFLPRDTRVYFTRGWGETFDLPALDDHRATYILVNEMSDDLPVYSWGPYVVKVFELMAEGYSMASTMHADTVEEVIEQLEGEGVPRSNVANLTFIVTVNVGYDSGRIVRRVNEAAMLAPDDAAGGLRTIPIAAWNARDGSFSLLEPAARTELARRLDIAEERLDEEISRRAAFLEDLKGRRVSEISEVESAVEAYGR